LARLHDTKLRVVDHRDLEASITTKEACWRCRLRSRRRNFSENGWGRPFPSRWSTKLPSGCASLTIRKFDEKESY